MKIKICSLIAAMGCMAATASFAMTRAEYAAQKKINSDSYKVSRDKCGSLKANAKDICMSEAKGMQKVANAELESVYQPNNRNSERVAMAKASAAYNTAKERCDDSAGNAKDVCKKDAKAANVKLIREARVVRTDPTNSGAQITTGASASKDENDAGHKAAAALCDSLAGAPKDSCMADAKTKFSMK